MTTITTRTPVSPKVAAAAAWAFLAPLLLAALIALVSYLLTDDGRALFAGLPVWLQVPLFAFVSALAGALAGYVRPDPLRIIGQRSVDQSVDDLVERGRGYGAAFEDDDEQLEDTAGADDEGDYEPRRALDERDLDGDGRDDKTGRFV